MPNFLCQLTFTDPEYRINRTSGWPNVGLSSAAGNLLKTNLLANAFPSSAVHLDWHNASLEMVQIEWLALAAMHLNPRVKQSRFFAILFLLI